MSGDLTIDQLRQTRERHEYPTTFHDPECGVPWPVCPYCRGAGLSTSAGVSMCPRYAREWLAAERNPCPDPATTLIGDTAGVSGLVCASHAEHPSADQLTPVQPPDG